MDSIKEGDVIPDSYVYEEYPTNKLRIREIVDDKRVIIIGFIGAFVPVCSRNFLAEYVENFDKLKTDLSVDEIYAIAVQDAFVLHAFRKCVQRDCRIRFLADQDASFVRAMGLSFDAPFLASVRSKRFSMIVDKGVVCELNVEPDSIGLTVTAADKLGKEKPKKVAYPGLLKPIPAASATGTIKESQNELKSESPRQGTPTMSKTESLQAES